MLDLQPIKSRLAAATPGPWRFTKIRPQPNPDADLIANAPQDLAALVAEVERLRDDNHALQAEIILTMEHHERIREAVARHRVQILDGGHPLHEDVMLWAVLDA